MRVAAVILNWNTEGLLRRFLPGLLESCDAVGIMPDGSPAARVYVADSASADGSLKMLAAEFPQVRAIPLDANYGFTGGYNRALKDLEADYYLLVNSDVDVPRDWLLPLVAWMDIHPDCGICGPKLHALRLSGGECQRTGDFEYAGAAGGYVDRFGYPFCRGRVLKRTEKDNGQYDTPADVLWVSGACLMIRSSLWKELVGFEEHFFAHMEEIDLCWRANRAGWKVTVVPDSVVWHLGGGTLPATSPWKLELNYRNNLMLLRRNGCSRLILVMRMALDRAAALVYLVTGRADCFRAVVKAHRGYRKQTFTIPDMPLHLSPRLSSMRKLCILPLAAIKGNGIFKYLKQYEDCH